jgi:translation initiation factor 2 subunit 3
MSTEAMSNQSEQEHTELDAELDMEDIMQNQAVINLGMVGHVANGKTTVTGYVTGVTTNKYASEKKQNKTIRLGYANFKVWCCQRCNAYESTGSASFVVSCDCQMGQQKKLITHISIVDCPGHNMLMSTMLNGSSVMDYTLLVESVTNKECPAPQTAEHFRATKIAGIPNAMILMNKIDIAKRSKIEAKMDSLENYVREETGCTNGERISPMIPVSATFGTNLDVVCEYLTKLQVPHTRDSNGIFEMLVIRSFDVNRPGAATDLTAKAKKKNNGGTDVRKIKGGVIGGSIMRGKLHVGDQLVVLPGRTQRLSKDEKASHETEADFSYTPIRCVAKSIQSEKNDMQMAIAGGLLGIQTSVDPAYTRNDGMTGSIVLKEADYLAALDDNSCEYKVYDKIVVKMESFMINEKRVQSKLPKDSVIKVNVNSNTIKAMVLKYSKRSKELRLFLVRPIPITILNDYVTIMLDSSTSNVRSVTGDNADITDDLDTSVLGAGRIVDGIEAFKV